VYSIKIDPGERDGKLELTQAIPRAGHEQWRVGELPMTGDIMHEPNDDQPAHIHQHIIDAQPGLAADASLRERLERAYAHAVVLGFTDSGAITQFLRYEAAAPNFYRQPAIDAWLRTPGQPVEQRFADVLARVKSRLRRD
jgi:hypothetical protein